MSTYGGAHLPPETSWICQALLLSHLLWFHCLPYCHLYTLMLYVILQRWLIYLPLCSPKYFPSVIERLNPSFTRPWWYPRFLPVTNLTPGVQKFIPGLPKSFFFMHFVEDWTTETLRIQWRVLQFTFQTPGDRWEMRLSFSLGEIHSISPATLENPDKYSDFALPPGHWLQLLLTKQFFYNENLLHLYLFGSNSCLGKAHIFCFLFVKRGPPSSTDSEPESRPCHGTKCIAGWMLCSLDSCFSSAMCRVTTHQRPAPSEAHTLARSKAGSFTWRTLKLVSTPSWESPLPSLL